MTWSPPPRPDWVERLIAQGDAVGGAGNLVGLDADELVATALESTGLGDFGPPTWREHYDVLLGALERESDLHLAGRILARTEVLRSLRNRLELARRWTDHPEVLDQPVDRPVFVVGTARSGTSLLHELLALDPRHRAPATWELLHPAHDGEPARTWGDRVHRSWADIAPEYEAMHHNAGDLPNECIFATMNEFLSDHWSGVHEVPTYALHLVQADHTDAYRYHRRILQTLPAREAADRWLLKAPSHTATLGPLFSVYPDATIVFLHRDPLKTVPSTLSLMATLRWMRCRRTDPVAAAPFLAAGYAAMLDGVTEGRRTGRLPDEHFVDVRYADLVDDPLGTVEALYRRCGWDMDHAARARMAERIAARPQGAHGTHTYALEDFGLDPADERARFAAYQQRFAVPDE